MTEDEYRAQLDAIEERLAQVYRERRALTAAYAGEHPAVLPPVRRRTATQEKVARCPRCSGVLSSEIPDAKK